MAKETKTPYAILGMLSIAPMSGYEIRQVMQQSTANFWSESDGQIYPTLAKLAKQGWVVCQSAKKTLARNKKIYSITSQGRSELQTWLKQEAETQTVRSEFMLKVFFGANVSPEVSLEHIQAHRYQMKVKLADLQASKQQLIKEYKDSEHLPYWLMSIDYGIRISEAKMQWCDAIMNELEKHKLKVKAN